jgi:hypothetical protein
VQRLARAHALALSYLPYDWESRRAAGVVECANGLLRLLSLQPPVGPVDPAPVAQPGIGRRADGEDDDAAADVVALDHAFARGELHVLGRAAGAGVAAGGDEEAEAIPTGMDRCPDGRTAVVVAYRAQPTLLRLASVHPMASLVDGALFAHLPQIAAMMHSVCVTGPPLALALVSWAGHQDSCTSSMLVLYVCVCGGGDMQG